MKAATQANQPHSKHTQIESLQGLCERAERSGMDHIPRLLHTMEGILVAPGEVMRRGCRG
eukprot:207572-Pelagomonas_calceolata.AAC.2